jgi:hypothetical protein
MDPATQAQIFEPFFTGKRANEGADEGAKRAKIQYDLLVPGAMWTEFRTRLNRDPAPWSIDSSEIRHWHRNETYKTDSQEMVMISQARVVVIGQYTSWHGCGGIRLATVIKSQPAYDPANGHVRA